MRVLLPLLLGVIAALPVLAQQERAGQAEAVAIQAGDDARPGADAPPGDGETSAAGREPSAAGKEPLATSKASSAPKQNPPAANNPPLPATPPQDTEALMADMAICEEDGHAIERLRTILRGFRASSKKISSVLDGSAPATLDREALERLLSADDGETETVDWPERIYCEQLQEKYSSLRESLVWQQDTLARQRRTYWLELPEELRSIMLELWDSRQRLAHSEEALHHLLSEESFPGIRRSLSEQGQALRKQRVAIFERMPNLTGDISPRLVVRWLKLWQDALRFSDSLQPPDTTPLKEAGPELRSAVNFHYHLIELDASFQASRINNIRGHLWDKHPHSSRKALEEFPGGRRQVLVSELDNMRNTLRWLYLDAVAGGGEAGDTTAWQIFRGVEYVLGLLALGALVALARRSKAPVSTLLAGLGRNYRRTRGYGLFSRVTANLPEFLPWIIGWAGLGILDTVFRHYGLIQLIPFVLLGYIYVLYGLLCLAGEWFVHRVAEQGSNFLNTERSAQVATSARQCAILVTIPWLLLKLVSVTVGYSQSLAIAILVNLVTLVVALNLLLLPWRREFIDAVKSFLPEATDKWVEGALGGPGFLLLAPLLAPLLLLAILLYSLHKGLIEFDWYRKLMARSFKLRSGSTDEETAESDQAAMADYERWFADTIEGDKPPVIKVDTLSVMCDFIAAWQSGQSDDNSLLLTGERGSGKTTLSMELISWLSQQPEPPQVNHVEVPAKTISPEAVASLLQPTLGVDLSMGPAELVRSDEDRQPTLIILENAQNFFLREVGGLQGWEFLLELTRSRLRNVFWVVIINNQSWGYLANVFGADYQFSKTLRTRPWGQSDIRSLILSRNQLSGYQIRYDSVLLSTRGPEAGNIRNAEQLYFSLLWDACGGNPLLALGMWLGSVTVNGKTVTVSLPPEYSGSALERLGSEMYFVYAALVMHENMTSEELVAATSMTESQVRAALKIAFNMGFVQRSTDRRYRIVPLWHSAVAKLLSRKNLLHE